MEYEILYLKTDVRLNFINSKRVKDTTEQSSVSLRHWVCFTENQEEIFVFLCRSFMPSVMGRSVASSACWTIARQKDFKNNDYLAYSEYEEVFKDFDNSSIPGYEVYCVNANEKIWISEIDLDCLRKYGSFTNL
jgi:hypothetical protein